LACAQQLARAGHAVTVFERADRIGGLLRYGIPDFKLEKRIVERRVAQMEGEGVIFRPSTNVGVDYPVTRLRAEHDAIVLAGGATTARDLQIPGRELKGIHFAMEFLPQQNKVIAGDRVPNQITAKGKRVVVLGGGDTGSDCLGTSNRQGAISVHQFELLPQPPGSRTEDVAPWPYWPMTLRTSSSHEEGVVRDWSINTKSFSGDAHGHVRKLHAVRLEWIKGDNGRPVMREIPGGEFELDADLVLLALGFLGPERNGALAGLGVALNERGNVAADKSWMTSVPGVFACGDMRRGQSLVVWAIWEGRECARGVDQFLMGQTDLPASPDPF
jgi:glutamate synthase (NADPH/NADH) small chain